MKDVRRKKKSFVKILTLVISAWGPVSISTFILSFVYRMWITVNHIQKYNLYINLYLLVETKNTTCLYRRNKPTLCSSIDWVEKDILCTMYITWLAYAHMHEHVITGILYSYISCKSQVMLCTCKYTVRTYSAVRSVDKVVELVIIWIELFMTITSGELVTEKIDNGVESWRFSRSGISYTVLLGIGCLYYSLKH